jgi:putative ABC transport system substrate-binding protein
MKRREFIALLGGAAATWPITAWAQQPEQLRRIAVFMDLAEGDPEGQARVAALKRGLQDLGWIEGRNFRIESRGPRAKQRV